MQGAYLAELEKVLVAKYHATVTVAEGCVLVYLDIPVTDSMRQTAAEILVDFPDLTADIMGAKAHAHAAGQQPEALVGPRPQAMAAVRTGEASLTILARGLAALPAASAQNHQQHELSVRILLLDGYATISLRLLMESRQHGLWVGTVQLPPGCAGFKYVQLESGRWFGDPLVTFSLR